MHEQAFIVTEGQLATVARLSAEQVTKQFTTFKPVMTKSEVADYLRVSVAHVTKLMRDGDLPYSRACGEHPRFIKKNVDLWLEGRGR